MGIDSLAATACWRAHSWDWNWENPNANLNCVLAVAPSEASAVPSSRSRRSNHRYNMKHSPNSSLEGSGVAGVLFDPSEELLRRRSSPAR